MKTKFFRFPTTVVLLSVATVAIIAATFIEAYSGTPAARRLVYNAFWFELVLGLLAVNIVGSLFVHKSFQWRKITVPLFHLSFVLIMIGAFFTRHTGVEGMVHIREGETTNVVQMENKTNMTLPFELTLRDFELKRYPGSNSPSSYSSYVMVSDPSKQKQFDYHIYMNHILKYRGWRFFQSSYDEDEQGTVLSASHDTIGTPITYWGYFIMSVTLLLSLFLPGTFFRRQLSKLRTTTAIVALLLIPVFGFSNNEIDASKVVPAKQAEKFGEVVVQDFKGRMKTMNTLNSEFMRKLYGAEKMGDLTADRVVLSMIAFPEYWATVPFIKISNKELRNDLKLEGKYISYEKLFHPSDGRYLLNFPVSQSFMKPEKERGKKDKALIQLDDEANLLHYLLSGNALTIFPVRNAVNNKWYASGQASVLAGNEEDSLFLANILPLYLQEITRATGNYSSADQYLQAIKKYQETIGSEVILSPNKIKAELLYNRLNVFGRVQHFFGLTGFLLLVAFFVFLLRGRPFPKRLSIAFQIVSILLLITTAFGIGLRWFIGGYIPISNSFEVMIFLSAIVLFAGIFAGVKQPVVLSLSLILAYTFLMVSSMNNGNPEIGNLVPVLKSYWLSIHVAVITSSYALFALVMMIALINLVLYLFATLNTFNALLIKTEQLGVLIQILLIVGLYLLTIGTILGAVWANESWGRYWGWDAKETWALISVLIYAFVTHMRFIPAIKEEYWVNVASFWAFASIIMTFFGVNYLLTGLHSYAGVSSAKVPAWIVYTFGVFLVLTVWSGIRYYKLKK
jgi:cytochrome c-type biogenesis protein CcsB